jgi:adenylyltransferase/sulfurtransferase
MLSESQKQRYLRNIILPEIAEDGQLKLLNSRILVVGAGGLGSPALYYLAAGGVGNIGLVDFDEVEISNLQRQILHTEKNLGNLKVASAREKILALNSEINLEIFAQKANKENLSKLLKNYDLILDATDNFPTRFVINEVAHEQKKPLIFAAVKGFLGQVSVFKSFENQNPCYACFNQNIVDENFSLPLSEKGILGAVAGAVGAMQATTAIKEILGIGESLVGKILIFDFLKNQFRKSILKKNPTCPVCSKE